MSTISKMTNPFLLILLFASGILLYCSVVREMGIDYLLKIPNEIKAQTDMYGSILLTISAVLFAFSFFVTRSKGGIIKKCIFALLALFYLYETFQIATGMSININVILLILGSIAMTYVAYLTAIKRG